MNTLSTIIDEIDSDPISASLHSSQLSCVLTQQPILHPIGESYCTVGAMKSKITDSISPEELSRRWQIGLNTASRTLKSTTHQFIRTTGLLSKRFRTDKSQLRYKQLSRQYGLFYTNYLKASVKSIRGYIGGVLYTNKQSFKKFFPCETETSAETGRTIHSFLDIVGLPYSLHSDNHGNFKEGLFKKLIRKFGIYQSFTEPHSPWQNRAESAIGEVKRHARKIMQSTNTPVRLWCFCYEYTADLLSLCANGSYNLQGRTPYEVVMHTTPDISEYVSFSWYQWCWYFDENTRSKRLCRWLGPAHQVSRSFCSYILLDNAQFIARSTVIHIPSTDLDSSEMKETMRSFTISVDDRIGNHRQPSFTADDPKAIYYKIFDDDDIGDDVNLLPYNTELIDLKTEEVDDSYIVSMDEYIGANVIIPGKDDITPVLAKIRGRKRDNNGNPKGEKNTNPILDTIIYKLDFPDGRVDEYSFNIIAENLLEQACEPR